MPIVDETSFRRKYRSSQFTVKITANMIKGVTAQLCFRFVGACIFMAAGIYAVAGLTIAGLTVAGLLLAECSTASAQSTGPVRSVEKASPHEQTRSQRSLANATPPTADLTVADPESRASLDGQDGRPLELGRFRPQAMLKVHQTRLVKARFPVVDVHTHFGFRLRGSQGERDAFVELMNRNNIAVCVSLDARLGDTWNEHADFLWDKHSDRFVVFSHIDWQGSGEADRPETWDCQRPDFARRVAKQLVVAHKAGSSGLKIFKRLGLSYKNSDGTFVRIDDPRWDPIWSECGKLGLPVIIHTADPVAFFRPIDAQNERWEELSRHPDWAFGAAHFPTHKALIDARNRVIERHPKTKFIGAHMANYPEDLARVGRWLDRYPNLYVELASRIGELGRQPYTARKFFLKYADRILFGTDGPWPEKRIHLYWRFLETYDEYFPYSEKEFPPQGFWNIYGIGLPDNVLRKVYYENAAELIPGVRERLERVNLSQAD